MANQKPTGIEQPKSRNRIELIGNLLESGGQYDLMLLSAEVPTEQRNDFLKKAIRLEIEYYRRKGWTYDLRRHEQFPELSQFISETISGKTDSVNDLSDPDAIGSQHVARCEYMANRWAFAEGGQGALYEATDRVLGEREVAIKVLKNVHDVNRFFQEAEITARMDHPGIAAVYSWSAAVDERDAADQSVDRRPFYAMRLINGKPLQQQLADFHNRNAVKKIRLDQDPEFILLIESLISACQTITYAHSVGVLHCDVKPQNIMCGEFGATIVLDWGSAVSNPDANFQTASGRQAKRIKCPDWTGDSQYTTAYASPEQKERTQVLDATTDVYSLGATLYQVITGHSPIDQNDHLERQQKDQIGAVRRSKPDCPRALESICIRALRKNPRDRYPGPAALANDLSCWLRGEEVSAAPDNFLDKTFRLANRHRLATLMGLFAAGLILLGAIGYNVFRYQQLRLQASLDSGFSLIEDICGPLENGELQNPKELESVARLVLDHCNRTIENDTAEVDDKLMLARLFHLRALTRYYYNNHLVNELENHSAGDKKLDSGSGRLLDQAIDDIEQALTLFQSVAISTNTEFADSVRDRLAGSSLFKARLLFTRGKRELADTDDRIDLDRALAAIDSSEPWFSDSKFPQLDVNWKFRLAESRQLKGEIQLRKATQAASAREATGHYERAADDFVQCNRILEDLQPTVDWAQQKKLRALGRGYGYLGDVHRDLAQLGHDDDELKQYRLAFESFRRSLSSRQKIFELADNPESQRQLSRGYSNFAWTLRNLGVLPADVASREGRGDGAESSVVLKLEDSKLTPAQRQKLILKAIDDYMGEFKTPGEITDLRALHLLYRFRDLDERSSRREIGTALCLVSELYFQAAQQTVPVDRELLDQAEHSADQAEQIMQDLYAADADNRETKTGLAYCLTLVRQINHSLDPESDYPSVGKILDLLPKVTDQNATGDELFLCCIAYSCGENEFNSELENGLRKLAASGFQYDWRIKQHFNDENWKYFEAQKKATWKSNNNQAGNK